MNEENSNTNSLVDTTDCLEAVEAFRGWKNGLFFFTIGFLILNQICFWLLDTGIVRKAEDTEQIPAAVAALKTTPAETVNAKAQAPEIAPAVAKKSQIPPTTVQAEPNQPAQKMPEPEKQKAAFMFKLTRKHIIGFIRFANFLLVLSCVLYCLVLLFALKVSLLGRLGGINHIARAFLLSLVFICLLLPWQLVFPGIFVGAMFTPTELINDFIRVSQAPSVLKVLCYYVRYPAYCVFVILLLVVTQLRSARWSKAVLRRLEIMV